MSLKNDTFADLKNLTFALIGREYADTTASFGRLRSLWNYAAEKAFRQSDYWERYLVIGELRTVTDGNLVTRTEDSFLVKDAGTAEVNGLYVRNGSSADGNPAYTKYDSDGTTALYNLWSASNTTWQITDGVIDQPLFTDIYKVTSSSTTPPQSGWDSLTGSGEDPAPTLSAIETVDTFLRINKSDPHLQRSYEYKFVSNAGGANITTGLDSSSEGKTEVYLTHKKELDVHLDDASVDSTPIPAEFTAYMAHLAAYTWQRSVKQNSDEANFGLSLALVNSILEDELSKLQSQGISNSYIAKNIQTNYNQLTI